MLKVAVDRILSLTETRARLSEILSPADFLLLLVETPTIPATVL